MGGSPVYDGNVAICRGGSGGRSEGIDGRYGERNNGWKAYGLRNGQGYGDRIFFSFWEMDLDLGRVLGGWFIWVACLGER